MSREKKTKTKTLNYKGSDRVFNTCLTIFFVIFLIIIAYPLIFVVSSSFSSGNAVSMGRVILWPVEFTTIGYRLVFSHKAVWTGYMNTILYTLVGTAINIVMTVLTAYPLSRRQFQAKSLYMKFFLVSMFFGGGLIPTYLLVSNLGLVDTRAVMVVLGALSLGNAITMRAFFQTSIPYELLESAKMDGISDVGFLMKIVLPLSKAIMAVITLYYMVGHWNSYFTAMIYLRQRELYPLQLIIRDVLNASKVDVSQMNDQSLIAQLSGSSEVMKFALIIMASLPMLILYPFVQKFFEKGVMVGSLKG